jgi:hypothetical protein
MYVGLHVKSFFLCCSFNLTRNLSTNFSKTPKYAISGKSVALHADERTDRLGEASRRFSQV